MDDQFLITGPAKRTPDLMLGAQITMTGVLELHRGPGQRFSLEPFVYDDNGNLTYRIMDYLTGECCAIARNADWALVLCDRLNREHVHLDEQR